MSMDIDNTFVDSLGLSNATLFPTQGALAAEKAEEILLCFTSSEVNSATKAAIAEGWYMWSMCCEAALRSATITKHIDRFYHTIVTLGLVDDEPDSATEYNGALFCATKLAEGLSTIGSMDISQQLTATFCHKAYTALETILTARLKISAKTPMQSKDSAATYRGELCAALLKTLPYSGTVDVSNGMKVISLILLDKDIPESLKTSGRSALNTLCMVAKASIAHAGAEILAIVKLGGNDKLLMSFATMPELYTNNPTAVHENLTEVFFKHQYMLYSSVYFRIAQSHASVLVPHVLYFVSNIASNANVATVTLLILENIASADPDAVYVHKSAILRDSKTAANAGSMLAKLLGKLASAKDIANAPEIVLEDLVTILSQDSKSAAAVLLEVSNMMKLLSDVEVLKKHLPLLEKHKSSLEVAFTSISDFAAGRSLEVLTERVDELDAKINALNRKVAETCGSMADVIAFVDANMADMKDFLADVVKKLPSPKRLEVVGTLRKTLILHFECIHTGLEYPVTSNEWSKWLKMGFSLVKAGQAIIDIGMGNPLGLLKKGVECVQEIYQAYKTVDDDEFNTYITQPFLTSSEQDMLLEKLRDQGFFEVFAYDAQKAGWYLLHPEKDGKNADGEAGSVNKVRSKEGYRVTDSIVKAVKDAAATLGLEVETTAQSTSGEEKTAHSPAASSGKVSTMHGGRAAAMREQLGGAAATEAEAKLESVNSSAAYYNKVVSMEDKMRELEAKVQSLSSEMEAMRNQNKLACCVLN